MPSSCAERKTRIAISPRLATINLRKAVIKGLRLPRLRRGFRACRSDRSSRAPVAGLEKGPGRRADARRSAGRDHVARLKRHQLRQERHDRRHREDHLGRGRILLHLTVDRELDRQRLRVGHHVGRQDARAHRAERVVPLAVQPVEELVALARLPLGVGLERTVADVVDDRVAGDAAHRLVLVDVPAAPADHDAQLAFPVDLVGRDPRDHDRVAGVRQRRARRLHEDVRKRLVALGRRPPRSATCLA